MKEKSNEVKMQQMKSIVNLYQVLGGGGSYSGRDPNQIETVLSLHFDRPLHHETKKYVDYYSNALRYIQ